MKHMKHLRVGEKFIVDGERFRLQEQDVESPYDSGLYVEWICYE